MAAAVPTAASGLNDWSDTYGRETRAGLVHAMAMTTALSLYLASAAARARDSRRCGKALGLAGLGVLLAGGYLGGHLSFVHGVNVNRTAWQEGPQEWTPVLADADLADGERRKVDAAGISVLLYRSAGQLCALASTCSHMGGPWMRARSAAAVLPARGTAASSSSPMAASCTVRLARRSLSTRRRSETVRSRSVSRHDACRRGRRPGRQSVARLAA